MPRKKPLEATWTLAGLVKLFDSFEVSCRPIQKGVPVDTGILSTFVPREGKHYINDWLDRLRAPYLRSAIKFDELAAAEIERSGFPARMRVADLLQAPASVVDAYRLRAAIEKINFQLKDLRDWTDPNDFVIRVGRLLDAAIEVGELGQRMEVRPFEPDTLRGRKAMDGAKKGQAASYGSEQQKRQKYIEYRADYERERKAHPKLSRTAAAKRVANKFDVTTATILLHSRTKK